MKRLIAASALVLAGCAPAVVRGPNATTPQGPWEPPLESPALADEPSPGKYACFDEYGWVFPNNGPICPEGWGGRPPENPTPMGEGPAPVP